MSHILENLIEHMSKWPGLGPRSARRVVLHLIKNKEDILKPMLSTFDDVLKKIKTCDVCHFLDTTSPCSLCSDKKRNQKLLCIVADVIDVWAIERTQTYNGLYHVLGGILSAVNGIGPSHLHIESLQKRINSVDEVIVALNSTIDGQTTAHYIFDVLKGSSVRMTQLALGIPLGGELDYLDDGTIGAAFARRVVA